MSCVPRFLNDGWRPDGTYPTGAQAAARVSRPARDRLRGAARAASVVLRLSPAADRTIARGGAGRLRRRRALGRAVAAALFRAARRARVDHGAAGREISR